MAIKKSHPANTKKILLLCLVGVILLIIVWAILFSTFRCTLFSKEEGSCLSISLVGKLELRNVEKAVITYNGQMATITDSELLSQLVEETQTANYVHRCNGKTGTIDLYRGDKLVRSMSWSGCCDAVRVYKADVTHWLFSYSLGGEFRYGYVYLSDDTANQLHKLIEEIS